MISRYARRTLGLFFLANLMNFYDRQIVAALVEAIKAEFAPTDAQVGGLNAAFEVAYPLAAILGALFRPRCGSGVLSCSCRTGELFRKPK